MTRSLCRTLDSKSLIDTRPSTSFPGSLISHHLQGAVRWETLGTRLIRPYGKSHKREQSCPQVPSLNFQKSLNPPNPLQPPVLTKANFMLGSYKISFGNSLAMLLKGSLISVTIQCKIHEFTHRALWLSSLFVAIEGLPFEVNSKFDILWKKSGVSLRTLFAVSYQQINHLIDQSKGMALVWLAVLYCTIEENGYEIHNDHNY